MRYRVRGKHVTTKLAAEMIVEAETGGDAFRIAKALSVDADFADPVEEGEEEIRLPPKRRKSKPTVGNRALSLMMVSGLVGTFFYSSAGLLASATVLLLLVLATARGSSSWALRSLGMSDKGTFLRAASVFGFLVYIAVASTFSIVRIVEERAVDRGTARIATLLADARTAIEEHRNADAQVLLKDALWIRPGEGADVAQRALRSIALSEDPGGVERIMSELDDAEFDALAASLKLPPALATGYVALDAQVTKHALQSLSRVAETRRQRKIDRERAERDERERIAREEQEAAARKVAEATERARVAGTVREKMLADFKRSPVELIADIQVRARRGEGYTADVTVTNLWHVRHKQIRLQDAQTLLASLIAAMPAECRGSPRLNILDLGGNKVGGTDMWGSATVDD